MAFTRAELESFRDASVPDLIDARVRLLFVGINPGLWTAATATPFAHPGNRFYPALVAAGILSTPPSFAEGLSPDERETLLARGLGVTNLVNRATIRADELELEELRQGAGRLRATVERWRPRVVAVAGITAYRRAFSRPRARPGRQDEGMAGAELWVVPNPSGLNAHETVASLGRAYAAPAVAAGVLGS